MDDAYAVVVVVVAVVVAVAHALAINSVFFLPLHRHTIFCFWLYCVGFWFWRLALLGSKRCDTFFFFSERMAFSWQGSPFFFFFPAYCERGLLDETALGDGNQNAVQYRFDRYRGYHAALAGIDTIYWPGTVALVTSVRCGAQLVHEFSRRGGRRGGKGSLFLLT